MLLPYRLNFATYEIRERSVVEQPDQPAKGFRRSALLRSRLSLSLSIPLIRLFPMLAETNFERGLLFRLRCERVMHRFERNAVSAAKAIESFVIEPNVIGCPRLQRTNITPCAC